MSRSGECTACDGSGRVEADAVDWRGEHWTEERDCDDCHGTGEAFVEGDDEPDLYADVDLIAEVPWEAPL